MFQGNDTSDASRPNSSNHSSEMEVNIRSKCRTESMIIHPIPFFDHFPCICPSIWVTSCKADLRKFLKTPDQTSKQIKNKTFAIGKEKNESDVETTKLDIEAGPA